MPRLSKIARLPESLREQLNRRLADGHPYHSILAWLNELPEVAALLPSAFQGQPIKPNNLSNWRKSGYQDWLDRRASVDMVVELARQPPRLPAATRDSIADGAAALALAKLLRSIQSTDPAADPSRFVQLIHSLAAIRYSEVAAQRLRTEAQRLKHQDRQLKLNTRRVNILESKSPLYKPPIRRREKGLSKHTMKLLEQQLKLM
jgi:hypothetical protein